jgi:hypothetical protein
VFTCTPTMCHGICTHTTLHKNRCSEAASESAYVDILHYLRQKRCKRTPVTMARVAEFGTVAQVQQVFRTGIKGDSSACAYAAKR